jgi:hypothetical protein
MVRPAVAKCVGSCTLVAVTVAAPAEAGAVKSPLAPMLPALAVHVMAVL